VVPLVTGKGAGAEMRFALGVAVLAGITGVTVFGIFFTPVFYSVVRWFAERGGKAAPGPEAAIVSTTVAERVPVTTDAHPELLNR
jgi:hypothetical protein